MQTIVFRNKKFNFLFQDCYEFISNLGKKNIIVNLRSRNDEHASHASSFAFKTTFSGRRFYEFDHNRIATNDSNFLLLNNGRHFSGFVDSEDEVESLSIFFALHFVVDIMNNYTQSDDKLLENYSFFTVPEQGFFEKLYPLNNDIALIAAALKDGISEKDNLKSEQLLHELVMQLLKEQQLLKVYIRKLPFAKLTTKIEIYRRLVRAKDYMDSCFSENISLEKLAGIACMSEHHFLRHFKIVYKQTPYQYLKMRRIEEAKVLLKKTDYSFAKITRLSGFECPSNFSRVFKMYTSYTPRDF
jgi:AraC family transcriptional regulator